MSTRRPPKPAISTRRLFISEIFRSFTRMRATLVRRCRNIPAVHVNPRAAASQQLSRINGGDFPLLARHHLEVIVLPIYRSDIGAIAAVQDGEVNGEGERAGHVAESDVLDAVGAPVLGARGQG